MGCRCCKAKNQADNGTGLTYDGEHTGALLFYKWKYD